MATSIIKQNAISLLNGTRWYSARPAQTAEDHLTPDSTKTIRDYGLTPNEGTYLILVGVPGIVGHRNIWSAYIFRQSSANADPAYRIDKMATLVECEQSGSRFGVYITDDGVVKCVGDTSVGGGYYAAMLFRSLKL